MLILTRRKGESIYIAGDSIKVYFLDYKEGQAKLGISAPPSVGIHREEIYGKWKGVHHPVEPIEEEEREYNV
jgi:carbon storage regulator